MRDGGEHRPVLPPCFDARIAASICRDRLLRLRGGDAVDVQVHLGALSELGGLAAIPHRRHRLTTALAHQ